MTALVSGEADIGFMGSESSIYANEAEDYAVNFARSLPREQAIFWSPEGNA